MQLSFVVFGLAVLVAVLVKPGDARATPSRDELLDELTEELVVRYLDRTNLERSVQSIDPQGTYDKGTVRRWWRNPYYNTNNQQSASNTGNIGGNGINGNLAAGSIIGSNQGRSIDSQDIYDKGTVRRWWTNPYYNTNNQQSASNTGNIGGNQINGDLAAGSIIGSNQGRSIDSQGIYDKGTVRRWWTNPYYSSNNQQSASNTGNIGGNGINGNLAAGSIIGSNQGRSIDSQGRYDKGTVRRWWTNPYYNTNNQQSASNTGNISGNGINGNLAAGSIIGSNQGRK